MTRDAAARHRTVAHLVGVDIGGTKTRIMRASLESESVDDIVVPSAEWRGPLGDVAADAAALATLLGEHFGADVARSAIAVGAHGCEDTSQCCEFEAALRLRLSAPVRVVNDSELVGPAMGVAGAVGLVVGTGSIATARDDTDQLVTAGGWGWILGDEGGAPALVRDSTRAVLARLDAGDGLDALGDRLMTAFAVSSGGALALALTQATSPDDWGRHAPEVFAAADDGSSLADRVIRDAGDHLALLIDRLLCRGIRAGIVVAGGSVIEGQPRLQNALRDALGRIRPAVALTILDQPPVTGALALARGIAHEDPKHPHRNGEPST